MEFKYDRNLYLESIFSSNIVYFETALPVIGMPIKTLFKIKKIIAVTNYSLDITYKEGVDYHIENGELIINKEGSIPQSNINDFYLDEPGSIEIPINPSSSFVKFDKQKYSFYGEGPIMTNRQITITYEHEDSWDDFLPSYQGNKISKFIDKLKNKQDATILFYGDSITAGCCSSGTTYGGKVKPYAESYPVMVHKYLEDVFNINIKYVNTAVPGMDTLWGLNNVEKNVNQFNPDLLVLAFGMNDGDEPGMHVEKIGKILAEVEKHNPNIEVLLIASTIANPETTWFADKKLHYIDEYNKLNKSNVAIVDMTTMHQSLLKRKYFRDLTGNNINHPNDFLARIYAQAILKVLLNK